MSTHQNRFVAASVWKLPNKDEVGLLWMEEFVRQHNMDNKLLLGEMNLDHGESYPTFSPFPNSCSLRTSRVVIR